MINLNSFKITIIALQQRCPGILKFSKVLLLSTLLSLKVFANGPTRSYRVLGDLHGNFLYGLQMLHATGAFDFSEKLENEIKSLSARKLTLNTDLEDHDFHHLTNLIQLIKAYTVDYIKGDGSDDFNRIFTALDLPIKWKQDDQSVIVIQLGDIFDRGNYDIELFLLFHVLKLQAQKIHNKKLIMVVGNHELINLDGSSVEFLNKKTNQIEYRQARDGYLPEMGRHIHSTTYFGAEELNVEDKDLRKALSPGGKLAKLFAENSPIEIRDGILFTHGGLSSEFIQMDLGGDFYGNYEWYINLYKDFSGLNEVPSVLPPWLIKRYGKCNKKKSRIILKRNIIFDKEYVSMKKSRYRPAGIGPTWYRGYNHVIEVKQRDLKKKSLESINAEKCVKLEATIEKINQSKKNQYTEDISFMVVGHSGVDKIKSFCNKKIFYTEVGGWLKVQRVPQVLKLDVFSNQMKKTIKDKVLYFQFNF